MSDARVSFVGPEKDKKRKHKHDHDGDDDKVEVVAAAQVAAGLLAPVFNSSFGFVSVEETAGGVFALTLKHKHDADKLVILATLLDTFPGQIAAVPIGADDATGVQISTFAQNGTALSRSFSVTVRRIRS